MTLKVGDKAPEFTLPTDGNGEISLSKLQGKKVVLFFYPKDNTPGCTTESCDFRDKYSELKKKNAEVIGLSKCTVRKHDNFKAKHGLNFPIASDAESDVCEQYGVYVEKSMFGKKYMGIQRATFLIDEKGIIEKIWPKVKITGHIDEVLESV